METILVVAPHPDDETLGCGGTILKHVDKGDRVYCIVVTDEDRPITQVGEFLGITNMYQLLYPSAKMETVKMFSLVESIRKIAFDIEPSIVYIPNVTDIHTDHQIVAQACMSVFKTFYLRSFGKNSVGIKEVLSYEVPSETDASPFSQFKPNIFVDITKHIDTKIKAFEMYETEVHKYPMPRSIASIQTLARYRGSTVSISYAESFMEMWSIR